MEFCAVLSQRRRNCIGKLEDRPCAYQKKNCEQQELGHEMLLFFGVEESIGDLSEAPQSR